ncbi:MAG: hypothetical protein A2Y28_02600 [Chlamydiae bacterium GWC2_50_10]|nr:MAG: hypothetical protein A2Y28_02600 [Chlamydiae bacterium GWC2_50_10]OGN55130.1 MAG: hypothetical protein A2098_01505 [Chlamydiae bacterium GWF2_49_8]OGN57991.1 MAG: hypothetical protein A3D18_05560 [Chlamydiae bacterium RIFCSPHIGHO2_02_FULL_49_29]OGN70922.1 MAG: hypothetical protein A3G30_06215 [Chlamydiae bacterium RIFCSPLOWO2_12_FULL_49_12]HCJ82899.1 class I SAM-dependent methyltransferase [Parachlamydiales bacterium]HKY99821.1 class I SAM-dependent methyltransferase [Rhabdochlamydiace
MNTPLVAKNLSHEQRDVSFQAAKQGLIEKIQNRGELPHASVQKQLELLEQLSAFDLGKFLIERGGLNGYWTHYIIAYPEKAQAYSLHPVEEFLLNSAPSCLATQHRFSLFKETIQKHLFEGCVLASVPSGLMAEFLDLDFSNMKTFSLHGIDLDEETLSQAKGYAEEKGLIGKCRFFQKDAWNLSISEEYDLIASNGLAIYEADDEKVVALYRQFYNALKSKGTLITSFLTPPPTSGKTTEWRMDKVNLQDALLQKIVFADILNTKWQVFRSEETVREQLQKAGFQKIEILYDEAHIFPTLIAEK